MGVGFCVSVDGSEYSEDARYAALTSAKPFFLNIRAGRAKAIKPQKGLVVRAVDAKLRIFGAHEGDAVSGARSAAAVYGTSTLLMSASGVANTSGQSLASRYVDWKWDVADTTIPLAMLDGEADLPAKASWGGITVDTLLFNFAANANFSTRLEIRTDSTLIKYLVSAKPQWQIVAPAELGAGATGTLTLRVAYPDGEPVVGLRIRLASTTQAVTFADGAFSATATTDIAGEARVPLSPVRNGADSIHVVVDDPRSSAGYFDPPLDTHVGINASYISVDGRQCVLLPADPGVAAIPAQTTSTPTYAWDSGANSEVTRVGDLYVQFSGAEAILGGIVGFTSTPEMVPAPERIAHGWYLHEGVAQVYERGRLATVAVAYDATSVFVIQRYRGQVAYLIDGSVKHRSTDTLEDPVSVAASLFGEGDFLFEREEAPVSGNTPIVISPDGNGSSNGAFQIGVNREICSSQFQAALVSIVQNVGPDQETSVIVTRIAYVAPGNEPPSDVACGEDVNAQDIAALVDVGRIPFKTYSIAPFDFIWLVNPVVDGWEMGWHLLELEYQDPVTQQPRTGFGYLHMGGGV